VQVVRVEPDVTAAVVAGQVVRLMVGAAPETLLSVTVQTVAVQFGLVAVTLLQTPKLGLVTVVVGVQVVLRPPLLVVLAVGGEPAVTAQVAGLTA
jgi:hypothetical protein